MKLFRIYIGSRHANGAFTQDELRTAIKDGLLPHFQSITLMPGEGWFRGEHEHGIMVLVATEDTLLLLQCVEALRRKLYQDGIGVEFASHYHRVTAGCDLADLARRIVEPHRMAPRTMNPHYSNTVFRAETPDEGWPRAFAIITACDPNGVTADAESNAVRDGRLASLLKERSLRHWRATGGSPDFTHAEPGYAVEVSIQGALQIGRLFEQEAVFWIEDDELILVDCRTEATQRLGSWRNRIVQIAG